MDNGLIKSMVITMVLLMGASCSPPKEIDDAILFGTYFGRNCPPVTLYPDKISTGDLEISGRVLKIRNNIVFESPATLVYKNDGEGCIFSILDEPRYYEIYYEGGGLKIRIFSHDFEKFRWFRKLDTSAQPEPATTADLVSQQAGNP